jgi:hypothetical protein
MFGTSSEYGAGFENATISGRLHWSGQTKRSWTCSSARTRDTARVGLVRSRSLIAERVRAGMARARKLGKHLGVLELSTGEWAQSSRCSQTEP